MRKSILLILLSASLWATDEGATRQIFAHLKVHDPHGAVVAGKKLLELHGDSRTVRLAYIQALAEKGDEAEVFREWEKRRDVFEKDRNALEVLAWSVLKKGELSPQIPIRLSSLIGSSLTRDVKAVSLLVSAMRSSNALFRLFGVRFASQLGDGVLQEELSRLLDEEPVWFVRQEVIRAVGQLRMGSSMEKLMKIIANPRGLAEERVEAILALMHLYDGVRGEDLQKLCLSPRAGLRELGCELIGYYELSSDAHFLEKMIFDASPEVRMRAVYTFGLLGKELSEKRLQRLLKDSHPGVAIMSAWAICRQGKEDQGIEALKGWLLDLHPKWRVMAALLLSQCGPKAHLLMEEQMRVHEDPFVRVNLAIGLIGQRAYTESAASTLDVFLKDSSVGRVMWHEESFLRAIVPNMARHMDEIQNYPKIVDQLTRLDLLNFLCILKYPKAVEAASDFIKKETWVAAGAAARLLMQEGDEEALLMIEELLETSDPQMRVQAALMLAFYGGDDRAVRVLQEAYFHVGRETKIQILEAIGHVGNLDSIPFLIDILKEPFQLMRVIAASAIVQCLYH